MIIEWGKCKVVVSPNRPGEEEGRGMKYKTIKGIAIKHEDIQLFYFIPGEKEDQSSYCLGEWGDRAVFKMRHSTTEVIPMSKEDFDKLIGFLESDEREML